MPRIKLDVMEIVAMQRVNRGKVSSMDIKPADLKAFENCAEAGLINIYNWRRLSGQSFRTEYEITKLGKQVLRGSLPFCYLGQDLQYTFRGQIIAAHGSQLNARENDSLY